MQGRRKQLRTGGAIQIVKTHLYGEKLHSYGRTVKLEGASAPSPPPIRHLCRHGYNVDSVPVVSQTKSLVQAISGDTEGARKTQENFSRQCPVVSQTRSLVEVSMGDTDAVGYISRNGNGTRLNDK